MQSIVESQSKKLDEHMRNEHDESALRSVSE